MRKGEERLDMEGVETGRDSVRGVRADAGDDMWFRECLRQIASRYKEVEHVTGIQVSSSLPSFKLILLKVCNEPSPAIPAAVLCDFYEKVACLTRGRRNSSFFSVLANERDFEALVGARKHPQHVAVLQDEARELTHLHASMVGEWSASRPGGYNEEQVKDFAQKQVIAYNHSSHGCLITTRYLVSQWNNNPLGVPSSAPAKFCFVTIAVMVDFSVFFFLHCTAACSHAGCPGQSSHAGLLDRPIRWQPTGRAL
eukprot:757873-Hanusia_phi.AAC.3